MNVVDVLPRDAIPSVDDPEFGTAFAGADDEAVVVVDGDPPRAYPVRFLNYHEVVNDAVPGPEGERPVAVTWCPICGSAVVYDRRVGDRVLTFGVSGKLADDALVLYDRETESEWKQPTGECIAGPLAGERLTALPAAMPTYGAFRESHPDGLVLRPPDEREDGYDPDPYDRYVERDAFGLGPMRGTGPGREWDREDLGPKTVVLGIERGGDALGVPLPEVEAAGGALAVAVGDERVLAVATDEGVHSFEHPGFEVRVEDGALVGDGRRFDPVTGESADGTRLERVPVRRLFAFAWQDDHGPDAFYGR